MKKRSFVRLLLSNIFLLALSSMIASPASAELLIDFQSGVITAGGRQQIDVYLESTSTDDFFLYDVIFGIEPVSATAGTSVTFIDPMNEDFITSNDYVFAGNSSQAAVPPSNVFAVTNSPAPPAVSAFDETADGFDVSIGTNRTLLSRLMVQHNLGGASPNNVVNDQFSITLFSDPQFDIAFEDFTGAEVGFSLRNAGILTVVAVPEPGTFAFLGLSALGIVPMRRRRI